MVIQHHSQSCSHLQCICMGSKPPPVHVDTTREYTSNDVDMDDAYKATTPHQIICAKLVTHIMMVEALSQTVCFINQIQTMPAQRITLNHQCKWWQQSMQKNHGVHSWWSGSTTMASTSRTFHPFDIVHLYKRMNERRYYGKIHGIFIPKRLGSHQRSLFI